MSGRGKPPTRTEIASDTELDIITGFQIIDNNEVFYFYFYLYIYFEKVIFLWCSENVCDGRTKSVVPAERSAGCSTRGHRLREQTF
jgi:hypothetical protein